MTTSCDTDISYIDARMTATSIPPKPAPVSLVRELGRTLKLALPVMLSRAGILIMVAVDTAMSGHAGSEQIGFYSIGVALLIPLVVVSIGLLTATMVMTAQAHGANQAQHGGTILVAGLFYAALLGLVTLGLSRLAEPALNLFGQDAQTVVGAAPVFKALGWGMPALAIYATASFFIEALHRPMVGTIAMLLANLLNAFLNWVLVFGNLGMDVGGATGAATATSITRWLLAIGILIYLWRSLDHERHGIGQLHGDVKAIFRRFLQVGWPMALGTGLESTAFALLMLLAGQLGPIQVGAYAIAHNINSIAFMLALGLSTAAGIRTGNAFGRRDPAGVRRAGWMAIIPGMMLLSLVALLCVVFKAQISSIYTADADVLKLAMLIIPFMALALIPDGSQVIVIGALRGANDFWTVVLAQVTGFWIVMVPLAWYFAIVRGGGVAALLVSVCIGALITFIITVIRFHRVSRLA